ncbi:magnesium transporter MRS2-3-like [Bidens hawaiensis]|uniref:magnesium transporter MRS2-3-like n=1 Tax=Bidens hawaiensis TaxID=980011 RepID=UPI00404AA3E1
MISTCSPVATAPFFITPEEDIRHSFPPAAAQLNVGGPGLRKKVTGVRTWLILDSTGRAQIIEAGKHSIMRRTGLPARDLRVLDPVLAYPSTVFGRERAIVVNLEHIKAIVTAQEMLLLNSKDPSVTPFVDHLQQSILRHHQATSQLQPELHLYGPGEPRLRKVSSSTNIQASSFDKRNGPKLLPFEFIALEACLEAACTSLDNEARALEQEAHPALDKLTSKISTLNLERIRQIKSRLVAITGCVQKVRDELEKLLDDDEEMAEMYLTHKLDQQFDNSSSSSSLVNNEDEEILDTNMMRDVSNDGLTPETQDADSPSEGAAADSHSGGTRTSTTRKKYLNVVELEMLVEAYFVQTEGTLNKLSTLGEYVDDTEDYIKIVLDDKQNQLLQMGVMLTTATLVVSAFVVVAGVFGMNVHINLFKNDTDRDKEIGMHKFLWTVGGGTTGSIFLYVMAIFWYKSKRILQ